MKHKRVLIYGDSNVWGQGDWLTGQGRMDETSQWPLILGDLLGPAWVVIQEGLPGRFAGNFETVETHRNGKGDIFTSTLISALPIDFFILALGVNDFNSTYERTSQQIYDDLIWYCNKLWLNSKDTPALYIAPADFEIRDIFNEESYARRIGLMELMQSGNICGMPVLDPGKLPLHSDGIHYTKQGHKQLAALVHAWMKTNIL